MRPEEVGHPYWICHQCGARGAGDFPDHVGAADGPFPGKPCFITTAAVHSFQRFTELARGPEVDEVLDATDSPEVKRLKERVNRLRKDVAQTKQELWEELEKWDKVHAKPE